MGDSGLIVLTFFFFTQKTESELRMRDWSSDVCSSDLAVRVRTARRDAGRDEHRQGTWWRFSDRRNADDGGNCQGARVRHAWLDLRRQSAGMRGRRRRARRNRQAGTPGQSAGALAAPEGGSDARSEERRGGKECVSTCRSRETPHI